MAQAARQERARKEARQNAAHHVYTEHVYTEEDLKRDKILTPEDQAKVTAPERPPQAAPLEQNAKTLPEEQNQQAESLGDVARRYREQRAARDTEQAEKKKFTPFPYKVRQQSLAAPKPEIAPLKRQVLGPNSRVESDVAPSSVLHPAPRGTSSRQKISPFQPRPLLAPRPVPNIAAVAPPSRARAESPIGSLILSRRSLAGLRPLQVQRGDSWWKLAERYLGSGTRWRELRGLNAAAKGSPERLRQGSSVLVPENPLVQANKPESHIVVKPGDTLWALARLHLGRSSAWRCLAEANPQVSDYTRLAVGTPLRLPTRETPESCGSSERLHR